MFDQERHIYSVSELSRKIKSLLENNFANVWVEGELSNVRRVSSGHLYFTLKDEESQLRGVLFRFQHRFLKFEPGDGLKVVVWGHLSLYQPRGEYQIIVDHMEPAGMGSLYLALEQLKKKLAAEGIFDESRKRPLPFLPCAIGLVTSPTGAAVRDMINIISRRFPNMEILLYPSSVQGEGASAEIARGIKTLADSQAVDVIIVGRGGGSLEDLWAFNEENVVRAIAASPIPVVSAVGHETDFTLADLVADLRAPTPSAAAELVVPEKILLIRRLHDIGERLITEIKSRLRQAGRGREDLTLRLRDPRRRLEDISLKLDDCIRRLKQAEQRLIGTHRQESKHIQQLINSLRPDRGLVIKSDALQRLRDGLQVNLRINLAAGQRRMDLLAAELTALNPRAILRRGYSIVRVLPGGEVVYSASQIPPGAGVHVIMHEGEALARIEQSDPKGIKT